MNASPALVSILQSAMVVARATLAPADGVAVGHVLRVDTSRQHRVLYGRPFGSTEWQLVPLTRMAQGYGADSAVWGWLRAHGFKRVERPLAWHATPAAERAR